MLRTKKSRRLLLYVALVVIITVSVPVAIYMLTQYRSRSVDIANYYYWVLRAVKPYNQLVVGAVPTTVVIGADGRPVAVVQGAILDADYWRSLLSSASGSGMLVVAGGVSVRVNSTDAVNIVESAVTGLCRRVGISLTNSTAIIFGSSLCPHCRHLKELFDSNGIRYVFADLATNTVSASL